MDAFELLVEAHRPAMKLVLAKLVEILRAHDVRYVIGGANALSLYVRPRMTIDIDILVDATQRNEVEEALSSCFEVVSSGSSHSKFNAADVEIDVRYATTSGERFALDESRDAIILGTKVRAPSPEALVWLYLLSKREQNFVDGAGLMRSQPALDFSRLHSLVEQYDSALIGTLHEMQTSARRPIISYEESRARRS